MAAEKRDLKVMRLVRMDSRIYYYYYKKVMQELKKQEWKRNKPCFLPYKVKFNTIGVTYNHDSFTLLKSMFKRLGWKVKLERFNWSKDEGGSFELTVERMTYNERAK